MNKKRLLSLILAVVMLTAALPAPALTTAFAMPSTDDGSILLPIEGQEDEEGEFKGGTSIPVQVNMPEPVYESENEEKNEEENGEESEENKGDDVEELLEGEGEIIEPPMEIQTYALSTYGLTRQGMEIRFPDEVHFASGSTRGLYLWVLGTNAPQELWDAVKDGTVKFTVKINEGSEDIRTITFGTTDNMYINGLQQGISYGYEYDYTSGDKTEDDFLLHIRVPVIDAGDYEVSLSAKIDDTYVINEVTHTVNFMDKYTQNPIYLTGNMISFSSGYIGYFPNDFDLTRVILKDGSDIVASTSTSNSAPSVTSKRVARPDVYSDTNGGSKGSTTNSTNAYYLSSTTMYTTKQLESTGDYKLIGLNGSTEIELTDNIVFTNDPILVNMGLRSFYLTSSTINANARFINLTEGDLERIDASIVDAGGNVIAEKSGAYYGYINNSNGEVQVNFNFNVVDTPRKGTQYYVKLHDPSGLLKSSAAVSIYSTTASANVNFNQVDIVDSTRSLFDITLNNAVEGHIYTFMLYKNNTHISTATAAMDQSGGFSVQFLQGGVEMPVIEGSGYEIHLYIDPDSQTNYTASYYINLDRPSGNSSSFNITPYSNLPVGQVTSFEMTVNASGRYAVLADLPADEINITMHEYDNEKHEHTPVGQMDKSTMAIYKDYDSYNDKAVITGQMVLTRPLEYDTTYYVKVNGYNYSHYARTNKTG
ncbi:hypothetical protein LJB89_02140, partial [Tyzzerella sp. OttesenSCG-928-J15]|nr:hypothetical protein [Tyzzerella sp. OttesenSCG-928-J15]